MKIWVCICGGVMGFDPASIDEMEKELAKFPAEHRDYWSFFNWYFSEEMGSNSAYAYSALWNDMDTYKHMAKHTGPSFAWSREEKKTTMKCSDCPNWYCNYDLEAKPAEGEPLRCQQETCEGKKGEAYDH